MNFTNRETQFPGKRKLVKVDENNLPLPDEAEIFVNIAKDEGEVYADGTPISAENLNKGNWRDDDSLSFQARTDNNLPAAKANETQIMTTSDGKTWLVPPAGLGFTKEIGDVTIDSGSDGFTQTQLLNLIYPIDSIYLSVNSTNPALLFGGSWVAWGEGRVPMGVGDNNETNYTMAETVGGSENGVATHTHAIPNSGEDESGMGGSASGSVELWTTNYPLANKAKSKVSGIFSLISASGTERVAGLSSNNYSDRVAGFSINIPKHTHILPKHTHELENAGVTGGNRMPFITCYMWKRVS